jgi:hypothetical protein
MRIPIGAIAAISLCACATAWVKPGAGQQDFNVDNAACDARSYRDAPPAISQTPYITGSLPYHVVCGGKPGEQAHCEPVPLTYLPPGSMPPDHNAGRRERAYEECMAARGWSQQRE